MRNWPSFVCLFLAVFLLAGMPSRGYGVLESNVIRVPVGGNSWIINGSKNHDVLSDNGLTDWTSPASSVDTYVRLAQKGTVSLSISVRVPAGKSRLRLTLLGQSKEFDVTGNSFIDYPLGQWTIPKAGYVKLTLKGVRKTGAVYADVMDFGINGPAVDEHTAFVRSNEGNFFYWGRRGPSVHLRYPVPEGVDTEWFYNEVTVPKGSDIVGSYYMANGFAEGYFGMQVNSPTERRILFSVWSPFQTDNPSQIPVDQKILLNRKGANVTTNEFGNEGAGGQSYLRYNWLAGQTYKFLVHAQPDAGGYTTYTAYFMPPDGTGWQLIASFKRPKTTTYLKSLYSFLENFIPETGNVSREVEFTNQWVRSKEGNWLELTQAQFTGDNTARKSYRMDYAGGLHTNHRFFLRNCGFFDTYTPLKTEFTRPAQKQAPSINVDQLP